MYVFIFNVNENNKSVFHSLSFTFCISHRASNLRVNCIKQESYKTRPLYFLKRKNDLFSNT